jgi:MFS family permease
MATKSHDGQKFDDDDDDVPDPPEHASRNI